MKPPILDLLASTRNMQTLFEKQDIVLAFDEWVELKDAFNQVVVSPPLEFRPVIERKKKTIVLKFDDREVLRDSATYVINFGEAIRDLTEGNAAPIVFVFSTGNFIDSLSVEGQVIDAYTAEPVKDVLFMLYENLADSVFRTDRPFYFARTNEAGNFKVSNMKAGKFKAVALVDQNLNYRFDNQAEKVAFLDSAIVMTGIKKAVVDTTLQLADSILIDSSGLDSVKLETKRFESPKNMALTLRLFESEEKLYLRDSDAGNYGKVHLAFSREPYDAIVNFDTLGQFTFLEKEQDTLRFWYASENDLPFNVYVQYDTLIDTIEVEVGLKEKFYEGAKLKPAGKSPGKLPVLAPESSFEWTFNHPINRIDKSLIRLWEDSLKITVPASYEVDALQKRKVMIKAAWQEDLRYDLEVWPGGLTDIFGLVNEDTLRMKWKSGLVKDYGTLTLKVNDLLPDTNYVIRLLKKGGELFKDFKVSGDSTFETRLVYITPDVYSIEIIEDLDKNGRWTTGDYDLKRQPERVHRATLEEVRANWEVDAEVKFDPKAKPAVAKPQSSRQQPTTGGRSG